MLILCSSGSGGGRARFIKKFFGGTILYGSQRSMMISRGLGGTLQIWVMTLRGGVGRTK
jgi:hypothetical protein